MKEMSKTEFKNNVIMDLEEYCEFEENEFQRMKNCIVNFINEIPEEAIIVEEFDKEEFSTTYHISGDKIKWDVVWNDSGITNVTTNKRYMVLVYYPYNENDWKEWLDEKEKENIPEEIIFYC